MTYYEKPKLNPIRELDLDTRDLLLPFIECVYKNAKKPGYASRLNKIFSYPMEVILCINSSNPVDIIDKYFDIPFCKRQNEPYCVYGRHLVERFSNTKQVVVGAVVHDDTDVLFLEAINQRRIYRDHNYTMILGHVDGFDGWSPYMTPSECFRINLARELSEELKCLGMDSDELFENCLTDDNIQYIGTFTSSEIPHSCNHIIVAYDVPVDDVKMFTSNEPDKHNVHTIPIGELFKLYDRLDGFFLKSISNMDIFKNIYNEILKI